MHETILYFLVEAVFEFNSKAFGALGAEADVKLVSEVYFDVFSELLPK